MGRAQRDKGKRGERQTARAFREAWPGCDAHRGAQSRSGSDAPDVDIPGLWIESKAGKRPSPRAALEQAQAAAPQGRIPLAVIRDDRKAPFVVLLLADFLELARPWWAAQRRMSA